MILDSSVDGVLRERIDTTARTITTYGANGAQTASRTLTAAEGVTADARAASMAASANQATIEQALDASLATLQATIDATNATINASPAAYIKDIARAQRRAIRLLIRRFDGTT